MKAFAVIYRPPYGRTDGIPQVLRLIAGSSAKEHAIQMAHELVALNDGTFGAVPKYPG